MNVGIVCYASMGGSGIVATELGKALATRGHEVHLISADLPFRLGTFDPGLSFHQVNTPSYPLFREPQYLLSLANAIVRVSREHDLEIVHAHYAVPHAIAAVLARQVLAASGAGASPRVVTTLHGTDITVVGADPSYSEIVAFSIAQSDGVTAVSRSLREATTRELAIGRPIDVIPNFLDCDVYRRISAPALRARYTHGAPDVRVVMHVSNFRPVKRIDSVLEVFARIAARLPSVLLLVGDGPEIALARRMAAHLGVADRVQYVGAQENVIPLLSIADLFLLPSEQESFGLAALEAMACEVPVVTSDAGGLPEVIEHDRTGFVHPVGDVHGMAESGWRLLTDAPLRARITAEAVRTVRQRFCVDLIVPMYEDHYRRARSGAA
ncbi:MAG TPA: N-acetyl-alpha-D-glucosaminyl L-malate synthase BshA [Vicinamibacterales bacterium]|nr:N-acetyl-alpha-D-glucosaminyl L-malate synthase BshA [Vicinamibacterales bacterium]